MSLTKNVCIYLISCFCSGWLSSYSLQNLKNIVNGQKIIFVNLAEMIRPKRNHSYSKEVGVQLSDDPFKGRGAKIFVFFGFLALNS